MTQSVIQTDLEPLQIFFHPFTSPDGGKPASGYTAGLNFMKVIRWQGEYIRRLGIEEIVLMFGVISRKGPDQRAAVMPQSGMIMKSPLGIQADIHSAKVIANGK